MKKLYLLTVFIFAALVSNAQEFSFKLYFETAGGSRDTIELGFDKNATYGLDTAFGEVAYSSPVSTDRFRVFMNESAGSGYKEDYEGNFLRKQIIPEHSVSDLGFIQLVPTIAIVFMFSRDSLPVTIKWDSNLFNNPKVDYSVITDGCLLPPDTWDEDDENDTNIGLQIGGKNFVIKLKDFNQIVLEHSDFQLYLNQRDTFVLFSVAFINNSRYSNETLSNAPSSISLYPNPVSDMLNLQLERQVNNGTLVLFDMNGKNVLSQRFSGYSTQLNMSSLPPGNYILRLLENNRSSAGLRVVKK